MSRSQSDVRSIPGSIVKEIEASYSLHEIGENGDPSFRLHKMRISWSLMNCNCWRSLHLNLFWTSWFGNIYNFTFSRLAYHHQERMNSSMVLFFCMCITYIAIATATEDYAMVNIIQIHYIINILLKHCSFILVAGNWRIPRKRACDESETVDKCVGEWLSRSAM